MLMLAKPTVDMPEEACQVPQQNAEQDALCIHLMCRKPSMTIWPVKVPVIVEFCPAANKATANSIFAA